MRYISLSGDRHPHLAACQCEFIPYVRILCLLSRVPYPLEKGDKLRAYHHLRLLSERHELVVVALADEPLHAEAESELRKFSSEYHFIHLPWTSRLTNLIVAAFKGLPYSSGYFYSKPARKVIDAVIRSSRPDHIYCQLTRMCEYARHVRHIPRTLDYQDAFSMAFGRRAQRESFALRWLFKMEQRRLESYETRMLEEFDNCTIISPQDREAIKHRDRDRIVVVPNGVDLQKFRPREAEKQYELLFTGNMAYPPNIESAVFIVHRVMPLVWKRLPDAKLAIVGATPSERVQSLASEKVRVTGWVDDIGEYYAQTKVFVAPMLINTGLQNKLLEAMSMRVPCITSRLANNAIGGKHGRDLIVCSDPEQYADAIVDLLSNPDKANGIAEAGRQLVTDRYSWERATQPLIELVERT
jgi:sugar transferase (PEP-CTERM/EpsH1 system associated)